MTVSDWKKMFKQLDAKPSKKKKYIKHNSKKEKSCGIFNHKCRRCGSRRGHIKSYGLDLCRRCFREMAPKIGFKKFS